jgi:plastocyanin
VALRVLAAAAATLLGTLAVAAGADVRGLARVAGRPLADVVVWLESPHAAAPTATTKHVVLDQRNLQFSPHVLAVQVGTIVDFPNNDRVFHNVFSFRDGKVFDLGMYPAGAVHHVTFDKAGLSRIFCNIHPGMAAYILAVASPYFALSDARGSFAIPSVEPGSYTFHAWRSGAVELTGTVLVGGPDTALAIDWP